MCYFLAGTRNSASAAVMVWSALQVVVAGWMDCNGALWLGPTWLHKHLLAAILPPSRPSPGPRLSGGPACMIFSTCFVSSLPIGVCYVLLDLIAFIYYAMIFIIIIMRWSNITLACLYHGCGWLFVHIVLSRLLHKLAVYIAVTFQCCLSANRPAAPCVLCVILSSWRIDRVDAASCSLRNGALCLDGAGGGKCVPCQNRWAQFDVLYEWWWEWNSASYLVIAVPVLLSSCLGVCFLWFVVSFRRLLTLSLNLLYQPTNFAHQRFASVAHLTRSADHAAKLE